MSRIFNVSNFLMATEIDGRFSSLGKKLGDGDGFDNFHKQSVNSLTERIAMRLEQSLVVLIPQYVSSFHFLKQGQKFLSGGGQSIVIVFVL